MEKQEELEQNFIHKYFDKLTLNQSVSYVNAEITKVGSVNKDAGGTHSKGETKSQRFQIGK